MIQNFQKTAKRPAGQSYLQNQISSIDINISLFYRQLLMIPTPIKLGKTNLKKLTNQKVDQLKTRMLIFRTGLVESNIRKLVGDLEKSEYILIAHIRPERIELPPEPEGHRYELSLRVEPFV